MQGLKRGFGSFVPTEERLGWNSALSGLRGKGQSCLCRNGGWKAQKSPGRVCSGMGRRECVPCFAGTRISRKAWKYSIPFPCPVSCAHQESSGTSTQLQPLLTAGEPSKDKHVLDPKLWNVCSPSTSTGSCSCTFIRRNLAFFGRIQPPKGVEHPKEMV